MAPAHDYKLDDLVTFGDLVFDLEAEVAERILELLNRLSHAVRSGRNLRVTGFVVYELEVDQFVQEFSVASGVDLLESAASCALVAVGRLYGAWFASIVRHHEPITAFHADGRTIAVNDHAAAVHEFACPSRS